MTLSKTRLIVIAVAAVLIAGAGFGLYKYRGSVDKSTSQAAEPREYSTSSSSPGNEFILGVSITCSAREVLDQFGNTAGWDVTITGENMDAQKKSTGVKIHVPWNTAIEGMDRASGQHRFNGPTPPTVVASAETFAIPGYSGSLTQCNLPIPSGSQSTSQPCTGEFWPDADLNDYMRGNVPNASFDTAINPVSVLEGGHDPIYVKLQRSSDKKTITGTVTNGSERCMHVSMGVYKMYDVTPRTVESQKYFSGKDNIIIPANSAQSFSASLPDCMAQIDIYGTSVAPRQQQQDFTTGYAGPPFLGSAFHLNPTNSWATSTGPFCVDTPTDRVPIGNFDIADCSHFVGWTMDLDQPTTVLDVHVYRDGAAGQGIFVGSFRADKFRLDVNNAYQVTGNHGFDFPTPEVFKDGNTHTIYVYAINPVSGKVNPLLGSSPKSVNCPKLPPPPPPPTGQCKLEIAKAVDKQTAGVGEEVKYTIDIKNSGSADCTGNVKIEDVYSAGVTFLRESRSSNIVRGYAVGGVPFHNVQTRTLTWDANVLSPSETGQITFVVQVNAIAECTQGTLQNKARATAKEYNNLQDWVTSNTVTTTVQASCPPPPGQNTDVGVEKSVSPSIIVVGQTANFLVKVKNYGPLAATGVQLKDVLPAGLTLMGSTPTVGTFNESTGVWSVGSLSVGQQEQLKLTVRGDTVGGKLNTVTITAVAPTDSNPGNNKAEATLTVVAPAVPEVVCAPNTQSIYLNQSASLAAVGGTGSYVWSAAEGTPSTGTGSTFNTQFVSTGTKTVTVASGQKQAVCTVIVSSVPTVTPVLDLAVSKQVSPSLIQVGQSATFTVTVTNRTQLAASQVRLSDVLPTGLTYITHTASQGVYSIPAGNWDVGSLGTGFTATLTLQVTGPTAGSFVNRVDIVSSTPVDSDSSNNTASATLVVQAPAITNPLICSISTNAVAVNQVVTAWASGGLGSYTWSAPAGIPQSGSGTSFSTGFVTAGLQTITVVSGATSAQCAVTVYTPVVYEDSADLSLTKSVSPATVATGGQAIFALVLLNNGPGVPNAVAVQDALPEGVEYISSVAQRGSFDPNTGIWTVGQIEVGEQLTLLITVKGVQTGQHSNIAEIWDSSLPDPDSTPGNGEPGEDDQATAILTVNGGLVNAGLPLVPLTIFGMLCAIAALAAIRIKTEQRIRLQTPVGHVVVEFK